MPTRPPLLAVDGADDTVAARLLTGHRETVLAVHERTAETGNEQAVVLYGPDRDSLQPTAFTTGDDTGVMPPTSPGADRAPTEIQIHSHPPPAPVAFSEADIRRFTAGILASPSKRGDPSGYAVVGQRAGVGDDDEAYIHSVEPTQTFLDLPVAEQREVIGLVNITDTEPRARAIQLDGDPNDLLAILAPYVRYDRRRFSVAAASR